MGSFVQTKSPLGSLTIQGIIISLLPTLLRLLDIDLGEDGAGLVAKTIELGMEFGGAVLAVYGRFRAEKRLSMPG